MIRPHAEVLHRGSDVWLSERLDINMSEETGFWTEQEIRDRLSTSTMVFSGFMPVGHLALSELVKHGISKVEVSMSAEQFELMSFESMEHMGSILAAFGIGVVGYHGSRTNFDNVETEAARVARMDICKRQIDTMLKLGGTVWSCHAAVANATVVKSYEELLRYVTGTNVAVAVENFDCVIPEASVEKRVEFLDALDSEQAGLVLDIGHVRNKNGANPLTIPGGPERVIELCGKHLKSLHLHGFKNDVDHWPPLVEGDTIQWPELFLSLCNAGYSGPINFEAQGTHYTDVRKGKDKTLSSLRTTLGNVSRFPREVVMQVAAL